MTFSGSDGGGGPLHGSGGREKTAQTPGNHFRGKTRETQQRKNAGAQSGKRQQKPRLPPHQGKHLAIVQFDPFFEACKKFLFRKASLVVFKSVNALYFVRLISSCDRCTKSSNVEE